MMFESSFHQWLVNHYPCNPARTNIAGNLQRLFTAGVDINSTMALLDSRLNVPFRALTLMLKIRFRCLYNESWSADGTHCCRLCPRRDSPTHLLGNCAHPQINSEIFLKHNGGAQIILTAWRNSSPFGGDTLYANVGKSPTLSHQSTCPTWLGLPCSYTLNPDILIIRGWPQDLADSGRFPRTRSEKSRVTLYYLEYKTCDDFECETITQAVHKKYTPTEDSPDANLHLFRSLRNLGWRVLGSSVDGSVGTSAQHDRMLAITVGHSAMIASSVTALIAREVLQIPPPASNALALALARHQTMCAYRIHTIANSLRHALPPRAPRGGPSPSSAGPSTRAAAG